MAEKGTGMRSSLSADDVGRPAKKPGKISADFLAQFESDPALSGSSSSLQFPHALPGHESSSDIGSASGSHEHLAPARRANVRISEPFLHSSNEELAAGIDHDDDDRTGKKRKSLWKWGPLKKVRRFFRRKKGSRRAKSCEDLPKSSGQKGLMVDDSQRYCTSSTPLPHKADVHIKSSPVMRSRSMPPQNTNTEIQELKKRQASSHEEVREAERSPKPVSKTFSLPTLHSNAIYCQKEVYTEEGAVSFENDPRESAIEGLQAAHDKIKAAPKKRRPPTRVRSRTTSLGLQGKTPDTQGQKVHKLSRTDPRDLTRERESGSLLNSSSLSDMTNRIFETSEAGEEEDGQGVISPQASQRDKEREDAVRDEVMSRVNDVLARTSGPSRLATTGSSLHESKTGSKTAEKEDVDISLQTKNRSEENDLTVAEKRMSFTDNKGTEKGTKFGSTTKETFENKELTVAEKKRSFTGKKGTEEEETKFDSTTKEMSENKEVTVAEGRSLTDKKGNEGEETEFDSTTKEMSENKELTVAEKRRSFTDRKISEKVETIQFGRTSKGMTGREELTLAEKKSFKYKKGGENTEFQKTTREHLEKNETSVQERRHTDEKSTKSRSSLPLKKSELGFADSISSSQAESKIVMAGNACQLESEVTLDDFEFDKILDSTENVAEESKKESKTSPKPQEPAHKQGSKPALPFKRGKSWSNSHKPRLEEFPFRQETTLSGVAKKDNHANILTEKREFVSRQDQGKDGNKPDNTTEESVPFRFSRTKSWSYGMKPGDVVKANSKENKNPTVEKSGDNQPAWIASAKQKSRRISQLLQEDETSTENQTPFLSKPNKNQINKPTLETKPQISPKPALPKKTSPVPCKPSEPPTVAKEQLKPLTQQKTSKQLVHMKVETKTAQQKPSVFGRNSATLPATKERSSAQKVVDKSMNRWSLNLHSKENTSKKTFGSVKIETCIVCGTTVYQMEKCKFDDSVLHRNCIKCTVCNRHLTVGNFVMAESKIYCKPHSQTVAVST